MHDVTRFLAAVVAVGLPLAGFTLWQLGPTGAAPLIVPYLIYSLIVVVFLLPAPRRKRP